MKITGSGAVAASVGAGAAGPAAPAAAALADGGASAALQSEVLQPAVKALAALPEMDHARVAELRDALAKGDLPFDPARLAGLIQKFHGSH